MENYNITCNYGVHEDIHRIFISHTIYVQNAHSSIHTTDYNHMAPFRIIRMRVSTENSNKTHHNSVACC